MELPGRRSGMGVLDRPIEPVVYTPQIDIEPEEIEDTPKNPRGGYLTVIENPLYRGVLVILMSSRKTDLADGYVFFDNYMIEAFGDTIKEPIIPANIVISEQESSYPPYYILKFYNGDKPGNIYPVASEIPLIPREISADEFSQFEANLKNKRLDDIVIDMVSLIVGGGIPEFTAVNDKLVVLPNYANIKHV